MTAPDLPEHLQLWQQTLGWCPTQAQQTRWQQLYQQLLMANRRLNLTRLTEPQAFWEKHLWDSMRGIAPWLVPERAQFPTGPNAAMQVIDIGTGGGFPGLPVAVVCPHWRLTLMDATRKKVAFLAEVAHSLGVSIEPVAERAEVLGQQPRYRARYDIALIRAVGAAPTCAEYALPLLKPGGIAVLYRGQWTAPEAAQLEQSIAQLGGKLVQVDPCQTPLTQGIRHYLFLQKTQTTPQRFPRGVGLPAKAPLGS